MERNNHTSFNCDSCGKFIKYSELAENGGASSKFIPDSDVSYEEIGWRCKTCTDTKGGIIPSQFTANQYNCKIH